MSNKCVDLARNMTYEAYEVIERYVLWNKRKKVERNGSN